MGASGWYLYVSLVVTVELWLGAKEGTLIGPVGNFAGLGRPPP